MGSLNKSVPPFPQLPGINLIVTCLSILPSPEFIPMLPQFLYERFGGLSPVPAPV